MTPVAGNRGGSRRGPRARPRLSGGALGLSAAVAVLVLAWIYLVTVAIDLGSEARGGRGEAWWLLGLASLGAVACLFGSLMLVLRILRNLGIVSGPQGHR